MRIVTERPLHHPGKSLNGRSSSREQEQRQSDLSCNEPAVDTFAANASGKLVTSYLYAWTDFVTCHVEGRENSKQYSRQNRQSNAEHEHWQVHMKIGFVREGKFRQSC